MLKKKNITLYLLTFLVVFLVAAIVLLTSIGKSGKPRYEGTLRLAGLQSEVSVFRDERGMPHIYASNEADLYMATGFIMAQERLWQMDLIRRATTGRLSEILGEDYLNTDLFLRSLDMTEKSKRLLLSQPAEISACLDAFVSGVNECIKMAGPRLPPEFRILSYKPDPWKAEDIANIIGYMGWDLASGNLAADIFNYRLVSKLGAQRAASLISDNTEVLPSVFPEYRLSDSALSAALSFINASVKTDSLGIHSFAGSNNWAVSGKRSTTGKPLLSNDMHLGLSSPGIWIQIHQVIPGKLNVTGVAVPGEPFIVAGHNEKIAWGMTNLMVDDIDLFAETLNPADSNQYLFEGEWKDMTLRSELISVKGDRHDTVTLRFTHRGPLISAYRGVNDTHLSMRWSGYDDSDELAGVYLLNRASGWDDFREAISRFRSVSQNFIYADTDGNIGLHTGGGIPVRKGHGSVIRDGSTGEYDWKGYVPFGQLPSSFNPVSGEVSSANNKTTGDDYPYYISYRFYPPYRIGRIREMLNEKELFDSSDFRRMLTDQHSAYAALLTPFILKLNGEYSAADKPGGKALSMLEKWDYDMDKDMAAPLIFEYFRKSLSKNLLADELGGLYSSLPGSLNDSYIYRILVKGADEWVDNIDTTEKESLDDIIRQSFLDCISELSAAYGEDPEKWSWGSVHKISLTHPLGTVKILDRLFGFNSATYPVGGSNHTVSPYSYGEGFRVTDGASERHIFNTADWDQSLTVIPTGISGVPSSEYYLSQTKRYLEGKFYSDAFSEAAVRASAKKTLRLQP